MFKPLTDVKLEKRSENWSHFRHYLSSHLFF